MSAVQVRTPATPPYAKPLPAEGRDFRRCAPKALSRHAKRDGWGCFNTKTLFDLGGEGFHSKRPDPPLRVDFPLRGK